MKCPYCGKEMDKGFFYSSKWDYTWIQKEKSLIIGEISQKNKVLVTTLTKRMAEDLTDYMREVGIRVNICIRMWIHWNVQRLFVICV